ncbi:MAG: phosphate ABC transporter permease PstA [Burkholderiaceae bacterium]
MTDATMTTNGGLDPQSRSELTVDKVRRGLAVRYAAEKRFKALGFGAVCLGLLFLVLLIGSITLKGYSAFWNYEILIEVPLDEKALDPEGKRDPKALAAADYGVLIKKATYALFPEVTDRREKRELAGLVSSGAQFDLRDRVLANPDLIGQTVVVAAAIDDEADMFLKGHISRETDEADRRVKDYKIKWLDKLQAEGRIASHFNTTFFTAGDSRDPEQAGIWGASMGSFYTLIVTLALSFPLGVAAAIYLEEFAPKNRLTDIIEVNINNLAAVPSIVFGLLGLAVFINLFGMHRSIPLVGGLVLTLMTLPTIIIASRAALKAVPPSIRQAALGIGASPMQTILFHVLPLAMPGMLTGTIIGMAQALGETAPLLMIGMVAFIVDVPQGFTDSATALPVQIYLWADSPERAFVERTSGAILVLLIFLILMNALAVLLRRQFERRW